LHLHIVPQEILQAGFDWHDEGKAKELLEDNVIIIAGQINTVKRKDFTG
jgi:hypothetical protein